MNIEIAEPGRMTQSGSSLLRLIQNNDMPLLDLLVRESIQNSLDAHKEQAKYVNICITTGLFNSLKFIDHLDGIAEKMRQLYPEKMQNFIAIRDSETVGLTGPLHFDDVTTNNYGNLLKLVYEISKPQENAGAGGSWGLGKTVYFRIGIGMVMYYSRIKDGSGYSSRLAVSMVENENSTDSIIPSYQGKAKRGIAWWGESIGPNKTRPIQDEKTIVSILANFGIVPFTDEETGTMIIIPYTNSEKLLSSNCKEYSTVTGKTIKPYWQSTLEAYFKVAVQRWYAPRLDNEQYRYGPYLKVFVNGEEILCADTPLFALAQKLYNCAAQAQQNEKQSWNGVDIYTRDITHRAILERQASGRVAYCKVSSAYFKEQPPHNKHNPYVYANCDRVNPSVNPPVLMYSRKPGMVVSYEVSGPWVDGISPTTQDEYIIGFFVLDSEVCFKEKENNEKLTLEEYIRRSELADHTSWSDFTLHCEKNANPRIVYKIRSQLTKSIAKAFEDSPVHVEQGVNRGLGKLFGDLLLPPVNFGKQPSIPGGGGGGEVVGKDRGATLRINRKKIIFGDAGSVVFPFRIDVEDNFGQSRCVVRTEVAAENKTMTAAEWELLTNTSLPFHVVSLTVTELGKGKHMKNCKYVMNGETMTVGAVTVEKTYTDSGSWYGIIVSSAENTGYSIKGHIAISSADRSVKASFKLAVEKQVQ